MRRLKLKKQKRMLLILLLLCITIGYAALTSNLNIVGTSTINNASWDVHWNNIQVTNGSVSGTNVTTAAHILTGNTEVEYSITLGTPGDFYEFTVDAVNGGSIDAMIGSFSNKLYESNGTTERTLPEYLTYTVTYSDGIAVANNHLLSANSTETYKVRVEFKRDINANQLPNSTDTLVFKFNVNYIQADSNATQVQSTYTGSIYRWNDLELANKGSYAVIEWGSSYSIADLTKNSDYITQDDYPTFTQRANAIGKNYYLKHDIVNDEVINSYVCFIYNNSEQCMKGGDSGASFAANTQIIQMYQSYYNLPLVNAGDAVTGCYFTNDTSTCRDLDLNLSDLYVLEAQNTGIVSASESFDVACLIDVSGDSYCNDDS